MRRSTHAKWTVLFIGAAAWALAALGATAHAAAVVYDLGTLGGTNSFGRAVNHGGQVAGYSSVTGDFTEHAFRYDGTPGSGGVMRDLGTLGGARSRAMAVNAAGQVAGHSDIAGSPWARAFRYDGTPGVGGVMHDLGTLGGDSSVANGINDAGQVVGRSFIPSSVSFGGQHAFRYDGTPGAGGAMRDLGAFPGQPGSTPFAEGVAVNNNGQVTGFSEVGGGAYRAFRYDGTPGSGGVMHGLSGPGFFGWSFGDAINDAGQVAGSGQITGSTAYHAFRYDGTPGAGGAMRDLGTLGGANSHGKAVNDAGHVAGFSEVTGSSTFHAFLYTGTPGAGGLMIDLDAWLDANNPTEGAKWTLSYAEDLSDTGWITGTGTYDPDGPGGVAASDRAYLLDASSLIPGPASLALTAMGGIFLLRWRRRPWRHEAGSITVPACLAPARMRSLWIGLHSQDSRRRLAMLTGLFHRRQGAGHANAGGAKAGDQQRVPRGARQPQTAEFQPRRRLRRRLGTL